MVDFSLFNCLHIKIHNLTNKHHHIPDNAFYLTTIQAYYHLTKKGKILVY